MDSLFLCSRVVVFVVIAAGCNHSSGGGANDAGPVDASPSDTGPPPTPCRINADCSGDTPFCSPEHVCVAPCTSDDVCSIGVCNFDSGECVDEQNIIYVTPTGSDTASCSRLAPCSFDHALAVADASRDIIKLGKGTYTGTAAVVVPRGAELTVNGFGATLLAPAGSPALTLNGGGRLHLVGAAVMASAPGAITCSNALLDLDQIALDGAGTAIDANLCAPSITRSSIRGHGNNFVIRSIGKLFIDRSIIDGGGGLLSIGGPLSITNSVIANQTGGTFVMSGLGEGDALPATVSFSTIFNSVIACPDTTQLPGQLNIDNSVVLNQATGAPADTITYNGLCQVSYSSVFPQSASISGQGNAVVDPLLKDPGHGDYQLTATSPAVDTADPIATLAVDLEGTPRPQGTRRDRGAFELKQ
jgi:hypothetical protein